MSKHAALSPSRAKDFKQCPLLFRLRVIDRITEPPSLEMLRGTLVHSVLEHLYDLPAHRRTEAAAQELLPVRWRAHLQRRPADGDLFEDANHVERWLSDASELIGNYFRMEKPSFLEPAARESFVNAKLPSGLAIRGIIDRVDRAPDGSLRIVDYKTGKSPNPRFQDDALFQMRFYAAAIHFSRGILPRRTQLIYLKDGRTLTYDPVPQDVGAVERELDGLWSSIEERLDTGVFEPKASRLCDWCHFKQYCPEYGGSTPEMNAEGAAALRTAKNPA
ncbi:MAG: PD-(D/E)XK nuclease family protein [Actinomycetaceae bacterium]|nr:PD-(D/E)XK nuclease family protein [Actinomycetaceae bacterium]